MPETGMEEVVRAVEIWATQRTQVFERNPYNDGTNAASLREFAEIGQSCAKSLIRAFRREDPEFWDAFQEVLSVVPMVLKGGKTFVNKEHVDIPGASI